MLKFDATKILRQVEQQASQILERSADDVFDVSQQLVPVDRGDLKASGEVVIISPTKIAIGYKNEAAKFQEYGTHRMPAQPFLTPAFWQGKDIVEHHAREARKR